MRGRPRAIPTVALAALVAALGAPAGSASAETEPAAEPFPIIEQIGDPGRTSPVVAVVHGGKWLLVGRQAMASARPTAERWLRRGFEVYSVGYSPGATGLEDLSKAIDRIRSYAGPGRRICIHGESAGGHLALMLAARRPDIRCVIASAAPADLAALGSDLAPIASELFGPGQPSLRAWSPVHQAKLVRARVLLEATEDDRTVPIAQQKQLLRRLTGADGVFLPPGPMAWHHGTTTSAALARMMRAERVFAAEVLASRTWQPAKQPRMASQQPQRRRCFGAGAMDPRSGCQAGSGKRSVYPTPEQAERIFWQRGVDRNSYLCQGGIRALGGLQACRMGASPANSKETVALIGDSHSAQWRPGLDRAGKVRNWSVYSLVQSGCDYTETDRIRFVGEFAACKRWRREIPGWLRERPQIRTVFVTQNSSYEGALDEEVAAYQRAWERLPPSVERIVVIRDNPQSRPSTPGCVAAAMRNAREPGPACRLPRGVVLLEDRAVVAARRLNQPRVKVIDLTRFFCNRTDCFPVVGGALVYAEGSHQTPQFNRSLAPYLLEELDRP